MINGQSWIDTGTVVPLDDLKTGWIKKDKAVQQIVVAGRKTIKKGTVLEHDVKIIIQYHSFGKKK